MSLSTDDFPAFFAAVNGGHEPFPWQIRFLAEVKARLDEHDYPGPFFPGLVDLPTGSGKTSIIDIAVFLLALEAERVAEQRRLPRRIVFVVDRRIVVDQAHEHARALAAALLDAPRDSVVGWVSSALCRYTSSNGHGATALPLLATVLRGGIVRDESWARRPDQPAIISSTVDQVGSRFLFRGYGVSTSMRPIHAGLLGSDTLFLLDEVHLSEPFAQTLRAFAEDFQLNWAERPLPNRWEMVELSATPGKARGEIFRLEAQSGDFDPGVNPTLPRRMQASKLVRLAKPVKVVGTDRQKATATFASACIKEVEGLLEEPSISTAAIVVNRVDSAVAAYKILNDREPDVVLLTGRMRPHDRDRVIRDRIGRRLKTGRVRVDGVVPFVVVATQCIEAGADLDFDGMVTEAASLDSLIQRFGRLDRDGQLAAEGTPARGVILISTLDVKAADDPVYGEAMQRTWQALNAMRDEVLDFGVTGLPDELKDDQSLRVRLANAPILFPGHLDSWVQTAPRPTPDPDPRFWLHGPDSGVGDVSIVWRSDLDQALLSSALGDDGALTALRTLVVAAPPGAIEAMPVPVVAARRWLAGEEVPGLSDVESGVTPEDENGAVVRKPRLFVRWAGDQSVPSEIRRSPIRPGDVLIVPAAYGGIGNHHSWDPTAEDEVPDLAERCQLIQRRRALLRLLPDVLRDEDGQPIDFPLPDPDADPDLTDKQLIDGWIGDHLAELHCAQRVSAHQIQRALRGASDLCRKVAIERVTVPRGDGRGDVRFVVTAPSIDAPEQIAAQLASARDEPESGDSVSSEPETSSFSSVEIPLDDHLEGVGEWARQLGTNCGLDESLVNDLELAGRLHDFGKADPRFQVMLRGGDPVAAMGARLAKSATPSDAYALRRAAQVRSGYPFGTRHELMSLAMIDEVAEVAARASDWDLVRYLVSSHHGSCRPFPPAVADDDGPLVSHDFDGTALEASANHRLEVLDSGVAERFWLLVRRYGWHRLAWLEAIIRLADHRRSEWEQRHGGQGAGQEAAAAGRPGPVAVELPEGGSR